MKEIGSEFSLCSGEDYYFKRILTLGKASGLLRSGRDALGYIANLLNKKSGTILLPAYCCNSMVQPFLINGWRIEYYPINSDLSVHEDIIISTYKKFKPDAILVMNYFGISYTDKIINFIKDNCPNIQIIEDITQILFDFDKFYTSNVDYYVGSIRKWMGIPDGSIIISTKREIPDLKFKENDFVNLRSIGLSLKEKYHSTNDSSIKSNYRNILADAENSLSNGKYPHSISPSSRYFLEHLNCNQIRYKRKWNAQLLFNLLSTIPEIKFPNNISRISENVPFSMPILIENRDFIQNELAKNGIFCAVLWPLEIEARKISKFASKMEYSMLSIPIDQRYDATDMDLIYNAIKKFL